ncbi:fluoride efflux transporter CrcB [Malaciobacter halophilus]|uniref:Fluoride-specific ion channel FluC n=1 Tax=Malaciobacter halophilus TaxID=197482 RepID=A0A2N1IZC2_9BACT|nr:fluoride efflux transporter CrcB [Malaciobacter halophilus]AXH08656.1 putative fluoride ion transporter [Malaciobacter halophilus]PKI79649.1 fluoride efflux transporter CrcB [Malaciobacter halophilus]
MSFNWHAALAIGIGGFLGAIVRAYAVHLTNKYIPLEFPLGILFVNILGSFLIGLVFAIFAHYNLSDNLKLFLTTGFLGALTTYSTFAIETFFLLQSSFIIAVANIVLNVLGTIFAAAAGYKILQFFLNH